MTLKNFWILFKTYKNNIFIFFISFVFLYIMFFSCYDNRFGIVEDRNWFNTWQVDSEALVIGRMSQSKFNGINSYESFLGKTVPNYRHQKDFYLEDRSPESFRPYSQQLGLQGIVFSIIDKITDFSPKITLNILYALNSFMLITLLYIVLYWFRKEFSIISLIFGILAVLNSNWLIVSARNLYWVTWTLLLPFVGVLLILKFEELKHKSYNIILFIFTFVSIFIRSACGYEFISTVMISAEVPIIYYCIKNSWGGGDYMLRNPVL